MPILVGSRGSELARTQVRQYLELLAPLCPGVEFKRRVITEAGDRDRVSLLADVAGRSAGGAFSSRLEAALAAGEIDVAVHSLKDLPTSMPDGLVLLAPPGREAVEDALCGSTLAELPHGARVGTGAPRRAALLRAVRPDLELVPIRGNVPGRLAALKGRNRVHAVVLAVAGLRRLGLEEHITEVLPLDRFPASPGQGALGIQIRSDQQELRTLLERAADHTVHAAVRAERSMLAELHGGCSVPVGAYVTHEPEDRLRLTGQVVSLDGTVRLTAASTGRADEPEKLGAAVALGLLDQGARTILAEIRPAAVGAR
ncbi:hydroxymethylbilane synthase (plasmid) [Streptomyces sp. NBC_01216]|uniref:hydroxymethylbilane synthase n=1 Tax=Streptomyces sp. NBC_01216 TaxID=2903778 RepID=UPI002E158A13|nr:hydroxymethylbilane synthase [Streptomyces sp. NBC_01216]